MLFSVLMLWVTCSLAVYDESNAVSSFGFRGSVTVRAQSESKDVLRLFFNGGLYECEFDADSTPYSCNGTDSLVYHLCHVDPQRSEMLIQSNNESEFIIEQVFVSTNDGLEFGVDQFCLFDADVYSTYDRHDFYYGLQNGTANCIGDDTHSQHLFVPNSKTVTVRLNKVSPNTYIDNGLVFDGSSIDSKCKSVCCGSALDVVLREGLIGWYKAEDFESSSFLWRDASGLMNDVTDDVSGISGSIQTMEEEGSMYLKLSKSATIQFPQKFEDYTIFFVNRGGAFSTNCKGQSNEVGIGSDWEINTHDITQMHRSNGMLIDDTSYQLDEHLCLKAGKASKKTSSSADSTKKYLDIKELIIYDRALRSDDIACIETYLGRKYNVELSNNIELMPEIEECTRYQFVSEIASGVEQAQDLCELYFNQDLASIHSLSDYAEVYDLCKTESYRCFLGGTDYDEDCIWEWSDSSLFDWNIWQTDEGCNKPQDNICVFPAFWDEIGLRDCSGLGPGYPICNRLLHKPSEERNKTHLNIIFNVCNVEINLDEFVFDLTVMFGGDDILEFGSSAAECFGLDSNLIYCYFNHKDNVNADIIGLEISSKTDNVWCFSGISIGIYEAVVPFDETKCPFTDEVSCNYWNIRSESLAADQYLSQYVSTDLSLNGNELILSNTNDKYIVLTPTVSPTDAPSYSPTTPYPTVNPTFVPSASTSSPSLPSISPTLGPSLSPTVSNTHVWITFDVCDSFGTIYAYDEIHFGFFLVGTTGGSPSHSSIQHCFMSEAYKSLDCFFHSESFIGELVKFLIEPISGSKWCFDGLTVRISTMIAPTTDHTNAKQILFGGDYDQSEFAVTDLSDQVNEGVTLSSKCVVSFNDRDDGVFIPCIDDVFILYPYQPRHQIGIKFHSCALKDSGMSSKPLDSLYVNIIGKQRSDEYETNQDWVSLEKPIKMSHFPRTILESGQVHWENIGHHVASNVKITNDKDTIVWSGTDVEGVLVGIRYKINAIYTLHAETGQVIEQPIDAFTIGSIRFKYFAWQWTAQYLPPEILDMIESSRDSGDIDEIDTDGHLHTLKEVYRSSFDSSTYIQLVNAYDEGHYTRNIYVGGEKEANFRLLDMSIDSINVDIFYIIRKCEWEFHRNQILGAEEEYCEADFYTARSKCATDPKCIGVAFDPEEKDHNHWCPRVAYKGEDNSLREEEGYHAFPKKCGGLDYEMPYISIDSYLDSTRIAAMTSGYFEELRNYAIMDNDNDHGASKVGISWPLLEQKCRDSFLTELASIHSIDQHLAAKLSKFERSTWVGLNARDPVVTINDDNTTNIDISNYVWSDRTNIDIDESQFISKDSESEPCCAVVEFDKEDGVNKYKCYTCMDRRIREALCTSYGWPSDEYRTFIFNIPEQINEISMIGFSIDSDQNDSICIDEATIVIERPYNVKDERAWIPQNWIGNPTFCDGCEETGYFFFKDPVCETEIVDVSYDLDNMEILENDESLAGFSCENYNRFADSECSVEKSYTFTEETSTIISHSKESSYSTSNSLSWTHMVGVSVKNEHKFDLGIMGTKTEIEYKTEQSATHEKASEETDSWSKGGEEGVTRSEEKSVSCSASIEVGKGMAQSYILTFGKVNVSLPTTQDIKLILCAEYYADADDDRVHEKYLDNVPGKVIYATTTNCKVEFAAPSVLRNDFTCTDEQRLAWLAGTTYIPLCNEDNPRFYDGCQCAIGDTLTEAVCSCCDTLGNTLEDGKTCIVDSVFGWENTCRALNCDNSKYAGQEIVVDIDTESGSESASSVKINNGDELGNNNDIAASIRFVGIIIGVLGIIAICFVGIICFGRDCNTNKSDFKYKRTAIDSEDEVDEL